MCFICDRIQSQPGKERVWHYTFVILYIREER